MDAIIQIKTEIIGTEETNAVNARALHEALDIKKKFSDWVKHQIKSLGLEKNIDYITTSPKREVANGGYKVVTEYILTLDAAKHIAMASRSAKGKEVRAYFIEVEKRYRSGGAFTNEAVMTLLQQMSDSISMMASTQALIVDRLDALEDRVQTHTVTKAMEHMTPAIARCMRGRKWSKAETDTLIRMYDEGYTSGEIGAILGKSAVAVRCRLSRLFSEYR